MRGSKVRLIFVQRTFQRVVANTAGTDVPATDVERGNLFSSDERKQDDMPPDDSGQQEG
jgi:hypothetical protein